MKTLEYLVCRVMRGDDSALIEMVEVASLRYPNFMKVVVELVNDALHQLGLDTPKDALANTIPSEMLSKLAELLIEHGEGKLYTVRTTRELKRVNALAARILRTAILAASDMYHISCPYLKVEAGGGYAAPVRQKQ